MTRTERFTSLATGLLTGIVVGFIAAFVHRYHINGIDLGLILGLVAAAAAGIFTRAVGGRPSTVWLAVGLLAAVVVVRFVTPGGDRVVIGDALGTVLTIGLPAVALLMAALPASWFRPGV